MAEDLKTIRKIKKIISALETKINDKLYTGEDVGNFAIRYVAYLLSKRAEKLVKRSEVRRLNTRQLKANQLKPDNQTSTS